MRRNLPHPRYTVALVSDEPIVITGLRSVLVDCADIEFSANSAESLVNQLLCSKAEKPLALIIDLPLEFMGSRNDSRFIQRIQQSAPGIMLVILTNETHALTLRRFKMLGIRALLSKKDDLVHCLPKALAACLQGVFFTSPLIRQHMDPAGIAFDSNQQSSSLTSRELEVIRLYARGMRVKEIASLLKRSVCTVAVHKHNAMQKLAITSNMQLLHYVQSQDRFAEIPGY
ncbi:response regulator transcription factor [Citrobacter sp. Cu233]|uniref:response regulator transcription factor n=1 Tax=Citrobacter sp. Cu233 TaxID=2985160 RepID=UPI0025782B84|nr:response regulator transcription factor [Citrobacter sp. Cu233]MDM2932056.1 response regulator transcription factor [Citrobacter sp. Cu233]